MTTTTAYSMPPGSGNAYAGSFLDRLARWTAGAAPRPTQRA